jgi:hypothetical protein
MKQNCAVFEK